MRLLIAWAPIPWLLDQGVLPDDAFYYFVIDRNAASGYGISFDGVRPTNGFHPLWFIVLLPVFFFIHGSTLAIHAVLTINALLGGLSIFLFYRIFTEFRIRESISLGFTAFFALSPTLLLSAGGTMNGLDTGIQLAAFLLFLFFVAHFYHDVHMDQFRITYFIGLGVSSALLFLARTDSIFFLFFAYIFFFYRSLQFQRRLVWHFLVAACITLLLVSPWLLWSYFTFGSFLQVSAKAVPFTTHEAARALGWTLTDYATQFIKNIADSFLYVSGLLIETKHSFLYYAAVLLVAVFVICLIRAFFRDGGSSEKQELWRRLFSISPLLLGAIVFLAVQTIRAIILRPWYHASVYVVVILFFIFLVDFFLKRLQALPFFLVLLRRGAIFYLFIICVALFRFLVVHPMVGDYDKYAMAQRMNEIVPARSVVGSWNAGIFGYFFTQGVLVNLDGVVNNDAYYYITTHKVREYAKKAGIQFLVDHPSAFLNAEWWDWPPLQDIKMIDMFTPKPDRVLILGKTQWGE